MNTISKQDDILLTRFGQDNAEVEEGEVLNDLELIPRFSTPMINVTMLLIEQGKARNKKKKIITMPEADDITKDMFSIV